MEGEQRQPGLTHAIDGNRDTAVEQAWEVAREAWADSPKGSKDEALGAVLETCADSGFDLLPDVIRRGMDPSRPVSEQRAFAGQLAWLAERDTDQAAEIYRELVKRTDRKPGVVTSALGGVETMRERDPDTFALLVAETKVVFGVDCVEWKKARSLLFDGSHSGYAAYNVIEPALRSENEVVRRMTARYLLPELATKAEYGKEILDLIEGRFRAGDDSIVLSACVRVLPTVFDCRPGQARRIMDAACEHESTDVRETTHRVKVESSL